MPEIFNCNVLIKNLSIYNLHFFLLHDHLHSFNLPNIPKLNTKIFHELFNLFVKV